MDSFSQITEKNIDRKTSAIAELFLKQNASKKNYSILKIEKQELINHAWVYLVRLKPTGFIIISPASVSPILAYSFKNDYSILPEEQHVLDILLHGIFMQKSVSGQLKMEETGKSVGPFIHALWGQVNCYDNNNNLVNVTNYYTPHHYAAGCVAISLSLVLHFYRWPVNGTGSYQYTDNYGSSTGTYSANFENTYYQWDNMLDRYKNRSSTILQREAAGKLAYDAAVALKTDFEHNGSTSNVNRIPSAGEKFFRYSGMERAPSSKVFWSMLDTNMVYGIPVIFAVKSSSGAGHAIVCDGLNIDEAGDYYYHLNMGWWGSSNGWYRIRGNWNAGGYTSVTDGIFYLLPLPQLLTPNVKDGQKQVTVAWRFPEKANAQAFELQQKIGDGSWVTMSNTIKDTTFVTDVKDNEKQYFRVRAKVAGRWPYDKWSNTKMVTLDATGISDNNTKDGFVLYPNPASDIINIRFGEFVPSQMVVYNIYGQQVMHFHDVPKGTSFNLNIEAIPVGFYFLRLTDYSNHSKVIKFLKQ